MACRQVGNQEEVRCIRNVVWVRPFVVAAEGSEVEISLTSDQHGTQVFCLRIDGKIYSKGDLILAQDENQSNNPPIDLNRLKQNGVRQVGRTGIYSRFSELGLSYGESLQTLERLWATDTEALGKIQLTKQARALYRGYIFQPSVVDAALQAAIGCDYGSSHKPRIALPHSVGEVNIDVPIEMPGTCYAHCRKSAEDSVKKSATYQISITDDRGTVLLAFRDFCMKNIEVH